MDPYNQWGDEQYHQQQQYQQNQQYQPESHEMNERAEMVPINYNQNTYMTNDARETSVESLNIDSMQAKQQHIDYNGQQPTKSYHHEMPQESNFWKYSEQIKSILAGSQLSNFYYITHKNTKSGRYIPLLLSLISNLGLLLLFCAGMHTVWTIYQVVFYDTSKIYRNDVTKLNETLFPSVEFIEKVQMRIFSQKGVLGLTIVMWYAGIMIGCFVSGWFLVRIVQKRNIYYVAALAMFVSGCLFYGAYVTDSGWQSLILGGRFMAGISHGLTYVAVFVQASENAARDFRRILATVIGLTMGFSMFISAVFLINVPSPDQIANDVNVVQHSEMSMGAIATTTFIFSFISVIINYLYSHETVPFLLYHNYREEEAQFTLAKLLGEDQNSMIVQQEFLAVRELCTDDYTEFPEGKIFTTVHRSLMSIPLSARITSAQCLNTLYIILIAKYIKHLIKGDLDEIINKESFEQLVENETVLAKDLRDISALVSMYNVIVPSEVSGWFVSGLLFSLLSNYVNWKRGLHFTTFLTGALMLVYAIFQFVVLTKEIAMLMLIIYVHFLALPIDILGYTYLMECFPISTKAKAIAFVTICENLLNSLYATMELKHNDVFIEFVITGVLFFVLGYFLFCTVPNTMGLSLGAAKLAYLQSVSNTVWWKQWIPRRFIPTQPA